jgi:membrane protein implicated in regulation of membrane protease activity
MKKKIFIGIAMSLFAVATVFNMNISEQGNAGDVSLDAIAVMAQANGEDGGGHVSICDPVWTVTYSGSLGTSTEVTITCTSGGKYICPMCFWGK